MLKAIVSEESKKVIDISGYAFYTAQLWIWLWEYSTSLGDWTPVMTLFRKLCLNPVVWAEGSELLLQWVQSTGCFRNVGIHRTRVYQAALWCSQISCIWISTSFKKIDVFMTPPDSLNHLGTVTAVGSCTSVWFLPHVSHMAWELGLLVLLPLGVRKRTRSCWRGSGWVASGHHISAIWRLKTCWL